MNNRDMFMKNVFIAEKIARTGICILMKNIFVAMAAKQYISF